MAQLAGGAHAEGARLDLREHRFDLRIAARRLTVDRGGGGALLHVVLDVAENRGI
jgi:hypothetical protein